VPAPPDVNTQERIRSFIEEELLEEPFFGDDPLEDGLLDSLGIEQLVDFLEYAYGIEFADEEVSAENFATVPVLAALVDDKRSAHPARRSG
jgi:acyl carrier protein